MTEATVNGSRRTIGRVRRGVAAALLFAAAMIHPEVGNAADDGGGFHHHFGRFHGGFGILGVYPPYLWGYDYPYPYYANHDHGNFGYDLSSSYYGNHPGYDPGSSYYGNDPGYGYSSRPKARQTWYYCSDPAGYSVCDAMQDWLGTGSSGLESGFRSVERRARPDIWLMVARARLAASPIVRQARIAATCCLARAP